MLPFHGRPRGHKAGVILIFVSTLLFIVGFCAPYWSSQVYSDIPHNQGITVSRRDGLWTICYAVEASAFAFGYGTTNCQAYGIVGLRDELHVARTLCCSSLIALLTCCVYAAVTNCTNVVSPSPYPLLEIGSTASGLLGFFGCLVFAASKAGTRDTTLASVIPLESPLASAGTSSLALDWAFYLTAVACALTIIAAVLLSRYGKPVSARGEDGPPAIPMATLSQGQDFQRQGQGPQGQGQAPPAYQVQGQGQEQYLNQGQGYVPAQAQGRAQGQSQSQGQVSAGGQPQGLGPIQFVGAVQDSPTPIHESKETLRLQDRDDDSAPNSEEDSAT